MLLRSSIYRGAHPDRLLSIGSSGERGVMLATVNDGRMFYVTATRPQAYLPRVGAELATLTAEGAGFVVTPYSPHLRAPFVHVDAAHVLAGDRLTVEPHHTGRGYVVNWTARDGRTAVGVVGECDPARVHRTEHAAKAWALRTVGAKAVRA